jgi:predicted dehydrogenase
MAARAPIKAGIVGFGGSANVYNLPYILPNKDIEVYAFLQRKGPNDPNLGRFGHCTEKFPQARHYSKAEDVSLPPSSLLPTTPSTFPCNPLSHAAPVLR